MYSSSLSLHAILIAIANVPIGNTYLIQPIIPPNRSLNFEPNEPEFAYINIASKMLAIIIPITFISKLSSFFLF